MYIFEPLFRPTWDRFRGDIGEQERFGLGGFWYWKTLAKWIIVFSKWRGSLQWKKEIANEPSTSQTASLISHLLWFVFNLEPQEVEGHQSPQLYDTLSCSSRVFESPRGQSWPGGERQFSFLLKHKILCVPRMTLAMQRVYPGTLRQEQAILLWSAVSQNVFFMNSEVGSQS